MMETEKRNKIIAALKTKDITVLRELVKSDIEKLSIKELSSILELIDKEQIQELTESERNLLNNYDQRLIDEIRTININLEKMC